LTSAAIQLPTHQRSVKKKPKDSRTSPGHEQNLTFNH